MGRPGRQIDEGARALGQGLARLRQERGLTQVELARKLGLPQPMVSEYERGVLRLHGQLIVKLTRALAVTSDELLGLDPSRHAMRIDARFLRRLRLIDRLPARDQQALLRTLDAFLDRAQLRKTA